jgi:hypothetical protein
MRHRDQVGNATICALIEIVGKGAEFVLTCCLITSAGLKRA